MSANFAIQYVQPDGRLTSEGLRLFAEVFASIGGSGGSVAWGDVTGKPLTFEPSAHMQAASTVTDFSTAADARVVAGITGKQDTLVSATNIKTINGASVLGAGDLSIATGASPILSWVI